MKMQSEFFFYPIGQGIFSSGRLSHAHRGDFVWVYDCGAKTEDAIYLEKQLDKFMDHRPFASNHPPGGRQTIDILFISHFDEDHINGIHKLLSAKNAENIVLPFAPLWQRLAIFCASKISGSAHWKRFVVDPVRFIRSTSGGKDAKIIFVPPTAADGAASPADYVAAPDTNDDNFLLVIPELTIDEIEAQVGREAADIHRHGGGEIAFLSSNETIRIGNLWEFLTYNYPKIKNKCTPAFLRAISIFAEQISTTRSEKEILEMLAKIKRKYTRRFGKSAKERNQISLFMYAGFLQRRPTTSTTLTLDSDWNTIDLSCSCIRHRCLCVWHELECQSPTTSNASGLLMTGDGYLHSNERIHSILDYMGPRRAGNILAMQVMHHGSKYNWKSGLASVLSPRNSIFCARKKHYGHPHRHVLKDFSAHNPVIVDHEKSFAVLQSSW